MIRSMLRAIIDGAFERARRSFSNDGGGGQQASAPSEESDEFNQLRDALREAGYAYVVMMYGEGWRGERGVREVRLQVEIESLLHRELLTYARLLKHQARFWTWFMAEGPVAEDRAREIHSRISQA